MDLIHPDYHDQAIQIMPYGKVFKLLDFEEEHWIMLEGAGGRLIVDIKLFLGIQWPDFDFGDPVRTLPPKSPKTGIIADIWWNKKESRPIYFLSIDGQTQGTRYWPEELERLT